MVCDDLDMSTYAIYNNPKAKPTTKKHKADLLEAFLGALYIDKVSNSSKKKNYIHLFSVSKDNFSCTTSLDLWRLTRFMAKKIDVSVALFNPIRYRCGSSGPEKTEGLNLSESVYRHKLLCSFNFQSKWPNLELLIIKLTMNIIPEFRLLPSVLQRVSVPAAAGVHHEPGLERP